MNMQCRKVVGVIYCGLRNKDEAVAAVASGSFYIR